MGENSKIAWTDHTFNPWVGCTKVSAGCVNCYAEADFDKRRHFAQWGPNGTRVLTSDANWRKPLKWNREAAAAGVRKKVFCASLADVFEFRIDHDRFDLNGWRDRLWDLIEATPDLDWLLLTKRPANVLTMIPGSWHNDACADWPSNVWLGTSLENQDWAARVDILRNLPAAVRFLSVEPMLGPLCIDLTGIHWVICGGESGPNARPMHPFWPRDLRNQCFDEGVPFFFKQWGEWSPPLANDAFDTTNGRAGKPPAFIVARDGTCHCFNESAGQGALPMVRIGKDRAGRLLDGVEWSEFPGVRP